MQIQQAKMREWAKMHGNMDGLGPLPLNWYEIETVLKPGNLNSLKGVARVASESKELPYSNEDASLPA